MKKGLKICFSIIGVIVILGIIFFVVDYNRVQKQKKPIFCIQNPAGIMNDGGTIEYFGLGYKVIDFNTLAGFDDIKIGTWSMDYNDFEEERKAYENTFEENQLTLKLDIEQYYGKLSNGTYRIVKPVYDNGYMDIYSNEFEIKL